MNKKMILFCGIGVIAIALIVITRTIILMIKKKIDIKTSFKIICGWIIVGILNLLTIWFYRY